MFKVGDIVRRDITSEEYYIIKVTQTQLHGQFEGVIIESNTDEFPVNESGHWTAEYYNLIGDSYDRLVIELDRLEESWKTLK